jgi:hypothetical protein
MLPHEKVPPFQLRGVDAGRSFAQAVSWANILNSPNGIFHPQASRAGNAFFNIQEALKSDRVPAHVDLNATQQQRVVKSNAPKRPVNHAHENRQKKLLLGRSSSDAPIKHCIGQVLHASADEDSSAGEEEDDFDYFKYCDPSHHDSSLGSRIPIAGNSQIPSTALCSAVRNWVKYFTPHELVSVDAACSIFSPGSNWPGNVNAKQTEIDFQNKRQLRVVENTLTSLVLRADAEKSFPSRQSLNTMPIDPVAMSIPLIPSQSKFSPLSRPPQPALQHSKLMPPPITPSDYKTKSLSGTSASKRPRGFRNDKHVESVGKSLSSFCRFLWHTIFLMIYGQVSLASWNRTLPLIVLSSMFTCRHFVSVVRPLWVFGTTKSLTIVNGFSTSAMLLFENFWSRIDARAKTFLIA